jgi:hypothetical protein
MPEKLQKLDLFKNKSGIVIPVILWWLGVPLTLVIILWLLF